MSKTHTVTYEGYLVVKADDEQKAFEIANKILGDSAIVNDGIHGEWELTDVTDEDGEY